MTHENDSKHNKSNGTRPNGSRRQSNPYDDLYALEEADLLEIDDEADDELLALEDEADWLDDESELLYQPPRRQRPLPLPQLIAQAIEQAATDMGRAEPPIWHDHPALNPVPAAASVGLKANFRLMQQLALQATATPHPAMAVALVSATLPLAIQQAPQVQQRLAAMLPVWAQAVAQVVIQLHKQVATRPYLAALPAIIWQTTAVLSRYASQKPLTPNLVRQALTAQALRIVKQLPSAAPSDSWWDDENSND